MDGEIFWFNWATIQKSKVIISGLQYRLEPAKVISIIYRKKMQFTFNVQRVE